MNIEDLEVMESVQEEEVDMYKVFSDLVSIGNRAKDIARYDIANDAFAVALDAYFDIQDKDGDENGPPPAWLEWETQDGAGDYPPEVYYDLLDICTPPVRDHVERLCIPVPLLNQFEAISALKAATLVERAEHGRETREDEGDEWGGLIEELYGVIATLYNSNQSPSERLGHIAARVLCREVE